MSAIPLRRSASGASRAIEAGAVAFRRATPADDATLRRLLRDNVMDGWVRLSLEREPAYFAAEGLTGESVTVLAEQRDAPHATVGMYTCSLVPVHYAGVATRACYLGGLRVNPGFRRRIRILRSGFESICRVVPEAAAVPVWFTSIAADNAAARRVLEAGLPGMPVYTPVGELETLALATRLGRARGLLRPAQAGDIPAMVELYNRHARQYQYSPVLSRDWLLALDGSRGLALSDFLVATDGPRVTAMVALWDQRRFKQTVARGYRFPLNLLRPAYNAFSALSGAVALPPVGKPLEQIYLAFAAFQDANAAPAMIGEALGWAHQRGARAGVIGLSSANPLLVQVKHRFRAHAYRTCIEAVTWPDQAEGAFSDLPPQPEVAIL